MWPRYYTIFYLNNFFSILLAELFEVEGILVVGNKNNSYVLNNTWTKIVVDLSNIFNKRIILLDGPFPSSHFYLCTKLRAMKRREFVTTSGIDSILAISLSSNPITIVLCNFTTSNNLIGCICLSLIVKSTSSYTLLI